MPAAKFSRSLRAAFGNALLWGGAWAALGFVTFNVLLAAGFLDDAMWWADGLMVAARLGFAGFLVGGAFSAAVRLLYQGRRLSQLSPVRFGIAGGLVAGAFVPLFLQAMNLLSGGEMVPMALVLDDGVLAALFGGAVAGGSIKLAQNADAQLPAGDAHGRLAGASPELAGQREAGFGRARRV
ncbi:MAG TPA: hypothetical protein VF613_07105 [Longimicrobium sp.]|jgi:hypothetical protein